jgi:drug/metabolite transporter (DMT)-like permease
MGFGAVLAGSPTFLFVRILRRYGVWSQLLLRSGFYFVVCFVAMLLLFKGDLRRLWRVGRAGFAASIFLSGQSIAIVAALLLTSAANVALIINIAPCMCALMDMYVLKEPVAARTKVLIFFGLAGVAIIIAGDADTDTSSESMMIGNIVALANPVSWAFYWTINRLKQRQIQNRQKTADEPSKNALGENEALGKYEQVVAYQLLSVCEIALISVFFFKPEDVSTLTPIDTFWLFLYGGVCLPVCNLLFSLAPRFISTAEMGCIKMFEVVLAPLFIYFYEDEVPTLMTCLGGAVIVISLLAHGVANIRAERQASLQLESAEEGDDDNRATTTSSGKREHQDGGFDAIPAEGLAPALERRSGSEDSGI